MTKKEKKVSNFKTHKRLLRFALKYKGHLALGIFFGIVTGGSLFGLLFQADKLLGSFSGEQKSAEVELVIQRQNEQLNFKAKGIEQVDAEGKAEADIFQEGDQVVKVEPIKPAADSMVKIPVFLQNFLEKKLGYEMYNAHGQPTGAMVVLAAIGLVLVMMLKAVSSYFNRYLMRWVGVRVVSDMRVMLFQKLMNQSMEFHGGKSIGDMMSRCSNDIKSIQSAVSTQIASMTKAPIEILAVGSYLIYFAVSNEMYTFLAIMFVGIPLSLLPVMVMGKRLKKYASRILKRVSNVMDRMQETLSCIRVVKAYNMEDHESDEFSKINNAHFKSVVKATKYELMMTPLMEFVAVISICVLMIYSHSEGIEFHKIIILIAASNLVYAPLKEISKLNAKIQQSLAAADRIFEYLDMEHEIPEKADAKKIESFDDAIVFDNVSFSYGEEKTLDNINLSIKKGQFVAFVGEAGSGKSTLVNMVARFYDIHEGSIKIDGTDVRDIRADSIHDLIGYVDQRTILFNNSAKYNVSYGVQGATDEQIIDAANRADVMSFISEKEEGLDFDVGAKGVKLSGGQCQRVAIARAMLKNPPIMILDEATSALDNVTEQIVQKAINELMDDRTVLAIAHRLSTIKDADKIFVLDHGKVVEEGTHDDLLAKKGQYSKMWNIQFTE